MQIAIINESVQRASHKVIDKICQDFNRVEVYGDVVVIAVADGHGSSTCKLSHVGSEIATEVFCKFAKELLNLHSTEDEILDIIAAKGKDTIPRIICDRWTERVKTSFNSLKITAEEYKNVEEINYELYGTTLLGMIITKKYIYAMQIGDGDIAFVSKNGVNYVVDPPKFLGTETFSLSNDKPWKNVVTHFQRFEYENQLPCMFVLSTDGFSNSFINDEQYKVACNDYFETVIKYGAEEVQKNLGEWLSQTSAEGCGDDVTLAGVCFFSDEDREALINQDIEVTEVPDNKEVFSETIADSTVIDNNQNESELLNTKGQMIAVEEKTD